MFSKLLNDDFSSYLRLSKEDIGNAQELFSQRNVITVIGPNGIKYDIGTKMSREGVILKKGWAEFSRAHHLCNTDKLIFACGCHGCFSVLIFDKNGMLVEKRFGPSEVEEDEIVLGHRNDKEARCQSKKEKAVASRSRHPRKRKDEIVSGHKNRKDKEAQCQSKKETVVASSSTLPRKRKGPVLAPPKSPADNQTEPPTANVPFVPATTAQGAPPVSDLPTAKAPTGSAFSPPIVHNPDSDSEAELLAEDYDSVGFKVKIPTVPLELSSDSSPLPSPIHPPPNPTPPTIDLSSSSQSQETPPFPPPGSPPTPQHLPPVYPSGSFTIPSSTFAQAGINMEDVLNFSFTAKMNGPNKLPELTSDDPHMALQLFTLLMNQLAIQNEPSTPSSYNLRSGRKGTSKPEMISISSDSSDNDAGMGQASGAKKPCAQRDGIQSNKGKAVDKEVQSQSTKEKAVASSSKLPRKRKEISDTSDSSDSETESQHTIVARLRKTFFSQRRLITEVEKKETLKEAQGFKSSRPYFLKKMKKSSVYKDLFVVVPIKFARANLPNHATQISLLVPGKTEKWEVSCRYRVQKAGKQHVWIISGGWWQFSLANNLEEGDTLVFEMMKKKKIQLENHKIKMKVHIFRVVKDIKPLKVL